jgi:hypothetical protein
MTITLVALLSVGHLLSCEETTGPAISGPDTTSHAFTWTLETIGASGRLNDVCIINDTLAYAVGELYERDSLGAWEEDAYNVVRWNGRVWTKLRIGIQGTCCRVTYPPVLAMWAVNEQEIFLTEGAGIATFDGNSATLDCRMNSLAAGELWSIFASSSRDIYATGRNGTIVHFNGYAWEKIESGTSLYVKSIFGARDPSTQQLTMLAVASGNSPAEGKKLLQIDGNTARVLPDSGLTWYLTSLWFAPATKYYVAGSGIYYKGDLAEGIWNTDPPGVVTSWATSDIKGNGPNDVLAAGSALELVHFNGATWRNYRDQIPSMNGVFGRVAIRGNLAIVVGFGENKGIIAVGRR